MLAYARLFYYCPVKFPIVCSPHNTTITQNAAILLLTIYVVHGIIEKTGEAVDMMKNFFENGLSGILDEWWDKIKEDISDMFPWSKNNQPKSNQPKSNNTQPNKNNNA